MIKRYRNLWLITLGLGLSVGAFLFLWPWLVNRYYHRFIYAPDEAPPERRNGGKTVPDRPGSEITRERRQSVC